MGLPSFEQLKEAHRRIQPYIHRTPVMTSTTLNRMAGAELFFKCENFQRMGAFKMRGAANAVWQLSREQKARGVATHSSGNFAQALALAAAGAGIKAYVVMPSNVPAVKKEAVRGYGGEVIESGNAVTDREEMLEDVVRKTGATFIHPSNNLEVILGNATAALELLQEMVHAHAMVCPVGGGGLLAGTALAAHYMLPLCKVYAGEPLGADDAWRSLQTGSIQPSVNPQTMADGLRTSLGSVNFPMIQRLVSDIIRVEEPEIATAMKLLWERMKLVTEPSAAVALAAVLKAPERFRGTRTGIILSGGNVEMGR
jgi:threonine dehydratase